ncbi:hypothetical protein BZG76_07640 [Salinivibrio sp. AR647]|uniref:hypothetical protein n=1 Tax=unclassified Salinivibrio TaxID=2636825 RepID=UPI00098445C5|nr:MULTISPECIES: hypothetical protein [unclassified Salinivibrio]OOE92405.1 hypothetical protein BZG76_07640 [Salinivibrio sp. AR647]OOF04082.1 hypothetical protein BZG80_08505 [Salinivibrio sp. MA440]
MSISETINPIEKRLYEVEVRHYWEHKGWGGKFDHLGIWGLSIFAGLTPFCFLWFVIDELTIDSIAFWGLFSFMTMMVLVSRYLFFPDKHRCYHLTPLGIHYTEKDMIPDVAYQVVRGLAWVGIVVCIIAVFVLGPLAFVGAGGFALMSFGMTNFRPNVNQSYILMDERTILFDLINDNVLSFTIPEKDNLEYKRRVYTQTYEEKLTVINHLYTIFPNLEVIKINRANDQYKHPIYQQEEESAAE